MSHAGRLCICGMLALVGVSAAARARAQQAGPEHPAQAQGAQASDTLSDTLEVSEAYPGLLQRAAVPAATAVRTALGKIKDGQLLSTRIEERGERLVYVIRIIERRGQRRECLVDAETGRLLANRKLPRNRQGGS